MADEYDIYTETLDADLKDLVPSYLENRKVELLQLREALANHDFAAIQRVGHNYRGSGYGFTRLNLLGRLLEKAAKARDEGATEDLLKLLLEYVTTVQVTYE